MVTFMKENGKMIRHTEKVFITIMMVPVIQANGIKIFNKVTEYKNGSMDLHTRGK
jgi:cell division protein FtsL